MRGHKSYIRDSNWRKNKSDFMKSNPILTEECREKAHATCAKILSIPIEQYDLNGNLLNIFPSIIKACKGGYFSISRNKFVNVKQAKGYRWKYKENIIW